MTIPRVREAGPAPRGRAWWAVSRCVATSFVMLARRQVHLRRANVGRKLSFADGSTTRVYRETAVDPAPTANVMTDPTRMLGHGGADLAWWHLVGVA